MKRERERERERCGRIKDGSEKVGLLTCFVETNQQKLVHCNTSALFIPCLGVADPGQRFQYRKRAGDNDFRSPTCNLSLADVFPALHQT